MADKLNRQDLDNIARAREVGPALRASTGDRDRLAGWLLKELADLAERLAVSTEVVPCAECGHSRTAHMTRAPSRPEPYFCAECGCRQYREAVAP
jgi:hypothetical protein